ncbi:TMEM165/GDT1 family protein [Veronia pacifica]|uniref:GDT1 family protein n=1 Tax=Veronia pacifica TaxID=1080227 RepID=A0A1C3ET86_9GAMM|nr:TMEM165/GDT1 family protein [Veronia pacifica]ODA36313.1 hypothetical protein A8L45_01110 [Veronia pacifica]
MSVLALSLSSIALAEIGDKSQILSFILASRFRKPIPIILAISLATLINHAIAAWIGVAIAEYLSADTLRWLLVASFIVMASWIIIPDRFEENSRLSIASPFFSSFIAFFIAEIGDKTQVATTVLGAQFSQSLFTVIIGTTIGMLLVTVPVIVAGQFCAKALPLKIIRRTASVFFLSMALMAAFNP